MPGPQEILLGSPCYECLAGVTDAVQVWLLSQWNGGCLGPEIVSEPQSVSGPKNATLSVSVTVSGSGPFVFTWPTTEAIEEITLSADGRTSTMSVHLSLDIEHTIWLPVRCTISNECGSVTTRDAVLTFVVSGGGAVIG